MHKTIFMIILCLLTSCAVPAHKLDNGQAYMAQGELISLSDGSEIELEVENYGSGSNSTEKVLLGKNEKTGETYKGNYLITESRNDSVGQIYDNFGFSAGTVRSSSTATYTLKGLMRGDKGSVIPIVINLGSTVYWIADGPGYYDKLKFYGEATDNKDNKYYIRMNGNVIVRQIDRKN
ncbi:MAG: hypothetical protein FDZ69_11570 [Deltaproteobacteria bacterium]|nr:MAG: hypothetical protein FDZ69_11570 [Deltaproteobacteria bacterium]